ncbi:MAG: hypothetical protein KDF59_11085 [Nitrosomonas sp.]|nr:hypothetical protein [Nitrosomonas sp.]
MSETNQHILRNLLDIKSKALDVKVNLIAGGQTEEAAALSEKINRLDEQIEKLRAKVLDDWLSKVDNLKYEIERINTDVQTAIDGINDNIDTARKVVKLTGYIDDAVKIAAKVAV